MKYIFLCLFVILMTGATVRSDVPFYRYKNKTTATIYNPYIWSAKLFVKCDWDGKRWLYLKRFNLPAKKSVTISVANGSRCQIWPSLL